MGEERVVAFDMPGTTRDSILVPFERDGQAYTLIDTAGVRRRARVSDVVEKFSVIKALQAIEQAHVTILVLDAREGVTDQDATLAGFATEAGRGLVLAVNKWDGLSADRRERVRAELERRLPFVEFAERHFISALHGTGVGDLFGAVRRSHAAAMADLSTSRLTRVLEDAVQAHQPPLVRGRRIKLRYAHQGGTTRRSSSFTVPRPSGCRPPIAVTWPISFVAPCRCRVRRCVSSCVPATTPTRGAATA
jgi:GTP-binding protein